MNKSDILVSDVLQAFLMHNEDRNHSPKTVRWYKEMLGRFAASLGPDADWPWLAPDFFMFSS